MKRPSSVASGRFFGARDSTASFSLRQLRVLRATFYPKSKPIDRIAGWANGFGKILNSEFFPPFPLPPTAPSAIVAARNFRCQRCGLSYGKQQNQTQQARQRGTQGRRRILHPAMRCAGARRHARILQRPRVREFPNPNGIVSISPGLPRRRGYPG